MSIQEQQELKERYYGEAVRYIENAKECLQRTNIEYNRYSDSKYVKMACGTAYSGVLVALDCFFILKGITKPTRKDRKSIEYYQKNLGKLDRRMLGILNDTYQILHLSGYYDGIQNVEVIKVGFKNANALIEKIKPGHFID
jgi:uncharacterized protein (UPF0332 family)